jgi:hypothetical protein
MRPSIGVPGEDDVLLIGWPTTNNEDDVSGIEEGGNVVERRVRGWASVGTAYRAGVVVDAVGRAYCALCDAHGAIFGEGRLA